MKKLITFSVVALLLSISTTVWANAPLRLHVHQTSGDIYSVALQDVSSLTFASSNLQVHAEPAQEFPLSGVRKITFDKTSAVDNLQSDALSQVFVSDGMLIIRAEQSIQALQIVNIAGQVVYAQQCASNTQELEIDAQAWTQGIYIVRLQTTNGNANTKVMLP